MRHIITLSAVVFLALNSFAALAEDDAYHTKTTTVQQDSNGNYNSTTTHNKIDANGNAVRVNTDVSTDADGNASVSKKVEKNNVDNGVSSKVVTNHTVDANGKEKATRYEEHAN